MSFEQLTNRLNEIGDLNKALSADADGAADDKKIADAAGGEGEGAPAGSGSTGDAGADGVDNAAGANDGAGDDAAAGADKAPGNPEDEEEEGEEGAGAPLAKSFALQLEDGTQVEAFDGTEMLKSFTDRLETMELFAQSSQGEIMKSLNMAADLISTQAHAIKTANQTIALQGQTIKQTGDLLKSLQERVEQLAGAGRGRASTVTLNDKPQADGVLAKSLVGQEPMGREEVLAKSLAAMTAGRISGIEAASIETRLNMRLPIEATLLAKINS